MNFIKLTEIDGSDIFMNMDNVAKIATVERDGRGVESMLFIAPGLVTLVKERPDQILDAMRITPTIIRS